MDLETIKNKLSSHRASGVRKIPEEIWKDVIQLSLENGIGTVGKELSLDTNRIRVWASRFGIEIPKSLRKKNREKQVLKISEVKFEKSEDSGTQEIRKTVLELRSGNGLCLSLFDTGSDSHLDKVLRLVKEAL